MIGRSGRLGVALTAGLSAVALAVAAPAASAAAEPAPGPGEPVQAHKALQVTASSPVVLQLEVFAPGGAEPVRTAQQRDGENRLTLLFNTGCPTEAAEQCATFAPAPNGDWVVRENGSPSRQFRLAIGGTPPRDVAAALAERTVTVSWKPGPERDVSEFVVSDNADGGASRTVARKDACADGTCTTTFDYPAPATGERSFSVRALRPSGTDEPAIAGPAATTGPVALPAPPADPTAGPTAGAPSATPGAPAAGGEGQAIAQSFAQGFSNFAPSLGLPKVPPLPATSAPQVANPLVADTFEETLEYGDREREEGGPDPVAAPSGRETVLQSTGGLLGDEQLLRSIAGALVMLLAAGHLRTWLARSRLDDLG